MKKKQGLALSLELVAVLTVLTGILTATVAMSTFGYRSYRVSQISKQINEISIAANEFKNNFNFYPGDISYLDLAGEMNSSVLKTNHSNVISYQQLTSSSNAPISARSWYISVFKSQLAFAQMTKSGLFNFDKSLTYTLSSSCGGISNIAGNLLPNVNGIGNAVWIFALDYTQDSSLQTPINSIVYDSVMYSDFKNKLRIIAISSQVSGCYPNISNGIGAISSDVAYDLDVKIDDGLVSDSSGKMIADASGSGGTCKSLNPGTSNPTVKDYNYLYNSSRKSDSCVLTVKI